MSAAPTQAAQAVAQHARYVTFLLGANDLCTSSPATMTDPQLFQAQYTKALVTLMSQNPQPYVFVSSVHNLYQLWKVLSGNSVARWVWTFQICQSILGANRTEEERQQVVERELAFNQILANGCAQYPGHCRWDGGVVYNYQFSPSQVSTLDYFIPA